MKVFNPEKELRKIQHGNKNKIIFGVMALLIIIGISSSYALYQIRYSKRIIYTKVVPFSNVTFSKPDNVTITPEKYMLKTGETKNFTATLPDNYKIDTVTCTNSDVNDITENTFKLVYTTSKASVCTVTIKEKYDPLASNPFYATMVANISQTANDDLDNNLRYVGQDPSNYIWFNCDDYDFASAEEAQTKNCEKWRIIGLFKNVTKTAGGTENLVKIIRDSVGTMAWDSANKNNWTNASLKTQLEGYYNGTKLSNGEGIKASTRDMIEQVTWIIGGTSPYNNTAAQFYSAERGTTVPSGAPQTYDGYIGLMYPSDYGYATTGGGTLDRDACLAYPPCNWSSGNYKTDCASNSWLYDSSNYQWTFMPRSSSSSSVFIVNRNGSVGSFSANYTTHAVRPSLYLKSSVLIANGDGSSTTPYILTQ